MFNLILKKQNLNKIVVTLVRQLRRNNELHLKNNELPTKNPDTKFDLVKEFDTNEMIKSFETKKSAFDKRKMIFDDLNDDLRNDYRIKKMDQYYNDELVLGVNKCLSLSDVLKFIQPQIFNIRPDHLECIYDKMISLYNKSKTNDFLECTNTIRESPEFCALLKQTLFHIRELDNRCLVKQLTFFSLINQDANTKIVKATLEMLKHQINNLDLDEIGQCLFTIFSESTNSLDNFFRSFRYALLEVAKLKITRNEFDTDNINLMNAYLKIFVTFDLHSNHNVIIHLIKILNLKIKTQFSFYQCVRLMTILQKLNIIPNNMTLQKEINSMIEKCNLIIYEFFTLEPSENKTVFYLEKLHGKIIKNLEKNPAFHNFFDHRILKNVALFIISRFQSFNKVHIFNLLYNFSKFNCWNENLMKKMYEEIWSNEKLKNELDLYSIYEIYSQIKLPFVELKNFVEFLFYPIDSNRVVATMRSHNIRLLIDFVLYDIDNEDILKRLDCKGNFQNLRNISLLTHEEFYKLSLTIFYLKELSKFDDKLYQDLESIFNHINIMACKLNKKKRILRKYFDINNKIQRNGYLSNGFYLKGSFGIYDKFEGEFLPLTEYKNLFDKVDQIPLNENQEIFTFVEKVNLKGDIAQYELYSTYQLKKMLKKFKINPIDVDSNYLSNLHLNDRLNYLLDLAKSNYINNS